MLYRELGKMGVTVSAVGFGGLVVDRVEPEEAARLVTQAVERGITYFDSAPGYGQCEERMGPALAPYRDRVFLSCKTGRRDRDGAREELDRSLARLHTDYLDLYQLHGMTAIEDVERVFAPDGAMTTILAAHAAGIVRHIGFSAHNEDTALALLDRFPFESVMTPINWACWYGGGYGPRIVARVRELGIGLLALKTLALRRRREDEERTWPKCWYVPVDTLEEALPAARFTLAQPVHVAISPSHAELLWLLCDAVDAYAPLTAEEEAALIARAQTVETIFPL